MNDAQIARGWAERAMNLDLSDDVPIEGYRAAARHILATTTPPTMADLEWDNDAHAGLCAESTDDGTDGVVRMIGLDWVDDHADHIMCYLGNGQFDSLPFRALTPIPGTRLDLTPRREPELESTPDHPTELTTEADYRNAPAGTVAATEGEEAWTKNRDGLWETYGILSGYNNYAMPTSSRRVLRWGWEA